MAKEQQIKVGDTVRMLDDGEYCKVAVAAVLLRLSCGGGDRSALA